MDENCPSHEDMLAVFRLMRWMSAIGGAVLIACWIALVPTHVLPHVLDPIISVISGLGACLAIAVFIVIGDSRKRLVEQPESFSQNATNSPPTQ